MIKFKMKYDFIQHKDKKAFENIKNKNKIIEIRLFDEKRKKIKINNVIKIISCENKEDFLFIRVIGISRFNSFNDLYSSFGSKIKNYEKEILSKVYSKEDEEKFGVLVIHFELI